MSKLCICFLIVIGMSVALTGNSYAACNSVSGNCVAPGGSNQLYQNSVTLVYYRNNTCSQSCSCMDAREGGLPTGCMGCSYQKTADNTCYSNNSCATLCIPLPELSELWGIAYGKFILIVGFALAYFYSSRCYSSISKRS